MLDVSERCPQCMHEIEAGVCICPFCGFSFEKQQHSPAYLKPGTILANRYYIGNVFHHNSEYVVYIAYDQHLGVVVDIKEFFPLTLAKRNANAIICLSDETEEEFYHLSDRFVGLHNSLSKLRTMGNLVQVYSVFEQHHTCYAVLEHIHGVTLRTYLSENYGELEWKDASQLFLPVLRMMTNLHKNGIVHGGLSPETIFVTKQGVMKITHFATWELRCQTGILQSQLFDGYAAPEQYNGDDCGTWTDVYSMAAVIYKSLTGTMPTASNTRSFNDNLIAPDILNAHVPKNVSLALMAALTLAPKLRTQTMEDLYADVVTPPRAVQKTIDLNYDEDFDKFYLQPANAEDKGKTRKIIFISLVISLSVVLFGVLILFLLLFGEQWFGGL